MTIRLTLAAALVGALAAGPALAATVNHKPVRHHATHHAMRHTSMPRQHMSMMRGSTSTNYGAPNRQPLSSGDSPTTPREGHVADPLGVPGSDAAIYNYSPDDRNAAYGY